MAHTLAHNAITERAMLLLCGCSLNARYGDKGVCFVPHQHHLSQDDPVCHDNWSDAIISIILERSLSRWRLISAPNSIQHPGNTMSIRVFRTYREDRGRSQAENVFNTARIVCIVCRMCCPSGNRGSYVPLVPSRDIFVIPDGGNSMRSERG
eukprot:1131346-Amphidinium_carterae.1